MTAKCQCSVGTRKKDGDSREGLHTDGAFFPSTRKRTETCKDNFVMTSQERHCVVDVVMERPGGGELILDRCHGADIYTEIYR